MRGGSTHTFTLSSTKPIITSASLHKNYRFKQECGPDDCSITVNSNNASRPMEYTVHRKTHTVESGNNKTRKKFSYQKKCNTDQCMIELDVHDPNPFLPQMRSPNTPLEIAQKIKEDIGTIEGPYYSAVLAPTENFKKLLGRTPPVLWLVADIHLSGERCAMPCTIDKRCYSLYKRDTYHSAMLDYLKGKAEKNWVIDWFQENWQNEQDKKLKYRYEPSESRSSLTHSYVILSPCRGWIRNEKYRSKNGIQCEYTNFRIHGVDMRDGTTAYNVDPSYPIERLMEYQFGKLCETSITRDTLSAFKTQIDTSFKKKVRKYNLDDVIAFLKQLCSRTMKVVDIM
jgi:hypothetical protein